MTPRVLDVTNDEAGLWRWLAGGRASAIVALELWDAESWHALAAVQAQFARDTGALVHLQYALNFLAMAHLFRTVARLVRAAASDVEDRWAARLVRAAVVRFVAFAFPIAVSTLFALFASAVLPHPSSSLTRLCCG